MTAQEQIQQMREVLRPKGTADLVGLRLNPACYVQTELVNDAIDEIERIAMTVALGGEVSALQKLGIMLLKDSAYLT